MEFNILTIPLGMEDFIADDLYLERSNDLLHDPTVVPGDSNGNLMFARGESNDQHSLLDLE